jgi:titin
VQYTSSIGQTDLYDPTQPPVGFTPEAWSYNNVLPGGAGINYGFRATGTFTVATAGVYSFAGGSDDGERLRIDGNNVIVFDAGRGFGVTYGTVTLSAGTHTFEWEGFQGGGQAGFELSIHAGNNTSPVNAANGWHAIGDPAAPVQLQGTIAVTVYYLTAGNVVAGNYIGTNAAGTAAIGNGQDGVYIVNSRDNVIGTDSDGSAGDAAEGNLISGNSQRGVRIQTAYNTVVAGNLIGTNAAGTGPVGNGNEGIIIHAASAYSQIGTNGDGVNDDGERNIISGNSRGIIIQDQFASYNTVAGNYIGTDISGTAALQNNSQGILIQSGAHNNTIGTDGSNDAFNANERNIISGNANEGVYLQSTGTSNNIVAGNYIGTDVTGTVALGNKSLGIAIYNGASNNTIGGPTSVARNIISGNGQSSNHTGGIYVTGSGTTGNVIQGNYIGTDVTGTAALGNNWTDLAFFSGASNNTATNNVISASAAVGVEIHDAGTTGNVVSANFIGTDKTGTAKLGNTQAGVMVWNSATGNTIGGSAPGAGNVISGNNTYGVYIIQAGTSNNTVVGNYIGTNAAGDNVGNTLDGV